MANRRMFSKAIIDSDLFLDMSLSAQALYFHLSMRADDDGFVNNPKKLQRMIGASDDDFKILIAKRFLIPFESGIVVIKHWRIHNFIRQDRYKETLYKEEKNRLTNKENTGYELTISDSIGIPNDIPTVYQMEPQVRVGNVNLSKSNLGNKNKLNKNKELSKKNQLSKNKHMLSTDVKTLEKIVDLYNQTCVSLPKVKILTEPRKRKLKTMLKKYSVEDFETVFKKAEKNSFLRGGGERGWKADFDWLIKEDHIVKILEGGYTSEERKSKAAQDMERDFKMYAEWAEEDD